MSHMEKLLMTWIKNKTQKHIPLSARTIMAKATSLSVMLKGKAGPSYNTEFTISSGWFK